MTPTVGRIVHFIANDEPAQAAIVIDDKLEGDRIRLQVFGRSGGRFIADVPATERETNPQGYSWVWPART